MNWHDAIQERQRAQWRAAQHARRTRLYEQGLTSEGRPQTPLSTKPEAIYMRAYLRGLPTKGLLKKCPLPETS